MAMPIEVDGDPGEGPAVGLDAGFAIALVIAGSLRSANGTLISASFGHRLRSALSSFSTHLPH